MPQVKSNVIDGWYRNDAKNAAGDPRSWSAATLTFKPGEVRFVPARARLESRSVNQAFEVALSKGLLVGPSATAAMDGAAAPEIKKPEAVEPETPAEEPAVEEPETPAEEPVEEPTDPGLDMPVTEPAGEPEPEAKSAASKATKKRRSRSKN
jgi:hypothetical protein